MSKFNNELHRIYCGNDDLSIVYAVRWQFTAIVVLGILAGVLKMTVNNGPIVSEPSHKYLTEKLWCGSNRLLCTFENGYCKFAEDITEEELKWLVTSLVRERHDLNSEKLDLMRANAILKSKEKSD